MPGIILRILFVMLLLKSICLSAARGARNKNNFRELGMKFYIRIISIFWVVSSLISIDILAGILPEDLILQQRREFRHDDFLVQINIRVSFVYI